MGWGSGIRKKTYFGFWIQGRGQTGTRSRIRICKSARKNVQMTKKEMLMSVFKKNSKLGCNLTETNFSKTPRILILPKLGVE
jgi:hypothetical protein